MSHMKLKNLFRRAAAGALCLFMCFAVLTGTANAVRTEGVPDGTTSCSLTATYKHVGKNVFLYRVAGFENTSGAFRFVPEKQFEKVLQGFDKPYNDLNKIPDNDTWIALAGKLDLAILKSKGEAEEIKAAAETETKDIGGVPTAKFEGLDQGLYLIMSERYSVEEPDGNGGTKTVWYNATPYLVSLPGYTNADGGKWVYDIARNAGEKMSEIPQGEIYLSVRKIWLNSSGNTTGNHPNEVMLKLLRDGEDDREIVLRDGKWSEVIGPLDSQYRWDFEEVSIRGWSSTIDSDDGRNYVVENRRPSGGGGDDPGGNDPPDEVEIDEPDVPLSVPPLEDLPEPPEEIEIDDPDVPLGDLPQTGQLWWPVPLLAVSGMFLLLVGWGRNRRGSYDEE